MSSALPDDGFAAPDQALSQRPGSSDDNVSQKKKNKKKGRGCLYAILVVIALGVLGKFACDRAINHFIADDPADVAEQAGHLADYKLPVGFEGKLSVRVPKVGQFCAFSRGEDGESNLGILVLAGLEVRMTEQDLMQQLDQLASQSVGTHNQQSSHSDVDVPKKCKLGEFDAMCIRAQSHSPENPNQVALIWQAVLLQQGDKTFVAAMADGPDDFDESEWQRFMQNLKPRLP